MGARTEGKIKTKITFTPGGSDRCSMPGRLADLHDDVRKMVAALDRRHLIIEKNPTSLTGYTNVITTARSRVPSSPSRSSPRRWAWRHKEACAVLPSHHLRHGGGGRLLPRVGQGERPLRLGERHSAETHGAQATLEEASTVGPASRGCSAACRA